jgi:altered-inheritance-of-mitochondria protein 13
LEGPETTPERQLILDGHIRERIRDELEHLKRDEDNVRREIEHALERENLDRESSMAGEAPKGESTVGGIKNSVSLLGDLEEIRTKIDKYQSNRRAPEFLGVEESGVAVAECYKYVDLVGITTPNTDPSFRKNKDSPLQCWSEVTQFKASVDCLEQVSLTRAFLCSVLINVWDGASNTSSHYKYGLEFPQAYP